MIYKINLGIKVAIVYVPRKNLEKRKILKIFQRLISLHMKNGNKEGWGGENTENPQGETINR